MIKEMWDYFFSRTKTGTLEKIDLTWGGDGNQVMTIDGKRYATWIDYKEWPKIGSVIRHEPYRTRSKYGHIMQCTSILKDDTPPDGFSV